MKKFLLATFCFLSLQGFGQDLTGIWRGHFQSGNSARFNLLNDDDYYKFEVQINQHSKKFTGVTYSYHTTVFYGKASCDGTINPTNHKVFLEEVKLLEVRMTLPSDACIMTCFLQYSKMGKDEFLEGTYFSTNTRDSSNCGRGTIFLRKVATSDFYEEPFLVQREKQKEAEKKKTHPAVTPPTPKNPPKQSTVKKPATRPKNEDEAKNNPPKRLPPPAVIEQPDKMKDMSLDTLNKIDKRRIPEVTPGVLKERENELVKTIVTSANEIVINIYDNGIIDNDSVSVYLDKKPVLLHRQLTEKPLTFRFKLDDDSDYHEVVMVADNLGEIPPNTSLMVVTAGDQRYEVHIASTEQKNAVVIFKYKNDKDQ